MGDAYALWQLHVKLRGCCRAQLGSVQGCKHLPKNLHMPSCHLPAAGRTCGIHGARSCCCCNMWVALAE